jgi:hypothetical protein
VQYLLAVVTEFLLLQSEAFLERPPQGSTSEPATPDPHRTQENSSLLESATVRRNQVALEELVCTGLLLTILLTCCLGPSPGWPYLPRYGRPI